MPNKDFQPEEEIIDLTELIESGEQPAKPARAAASYAKTAKAQEVDDADFDALVADHGVDTFREDVNANEELDMGKMGDIDDLLQDLDIPAQPASVSEAAGNTAEAAPINNTDAMIQDDLDSVLDDILGETPGKKAEKRIADEPEDTESTTDDYPDDLSADIPAGNMENDLDSLLNDLDDLDISAKPVQQPTAPPMPELDADLDDILSEVSPPEAPKNDEPAVSDIPDIPESLDNDFMESASLESVNSEPGTDQTPEKNLADATENLVDNLDFPDELDVLMAKSSQSAENKLEPDAISDISMAEEPTIYSPPIPSNPSAYSPELVAGICKSIVSLQGTGTQESLQQISREMGAQNANIENIGRQVTELSKRLVACEAKISSAKARVAVLENTASQMNTLKDLLQEGAPLHNGLIALVTKTVESSIGQVGQDINKILNAQNVQNSIYDNLDQKIEEKLNDSINKLENSTNSRMAVIEERIEDLGNLIIPGCQSSQISQTPENPDLENLIEQKFNARLSMLENKLEARLDELENSLRALTHEFNTSVERAAASAVAKILHEEISRLMGENQGNAN